MACRQLRAAERIAHRHKRSENDGNEHGRAGDASSYADAHKDARAQY
jgi:hypothetical protein